MGIPGNKLIILLILFYGLIPLNRSFAQTQTDSLEYIKINKGVIVFKTINSVELAYNFKEGDFKMLVSKFPLSFKMDRPIITRNGFCYGWHFEFNDKYSINIFFDKDKLGEKDNAFFNDLDLETQKNEKIKRIEIPKKRE